MGFVIFINETDWFEQNGYMKSDDKIIHFFENKKEDKGNSMDKLYEISQNRDNFTERFNESFNYRKLDFERCYELDKFHFRYIYVTCCLTVHQGINSLSNKNIGSVRAVMPVTDQNARKICCIPV